MYLVADLSANPTSGYHMALTFEQVLVTLGLLYTTFCFLIIVRNCVVAFQDRHRMYLQSNAQCKYLFAAPTRRGDNKFYLAQDSDEEFEPDG